ncbi:MAG: DUF1707 and DUF4190 domain-containing protein [Micromonosporaceae bacterium]
MATARGSGMAGDGFDRLRASNADRERSVDVLKAAFAEGRLTKDEFDERVEQVHAARTYAELGALTRDLPAGPFGALTSALPVPHPGYFVPARPRTNSMAVASLILALAQPFTAGLTAIPAVICGHTARRQIRETGESGAGLAAVGLTFGWMGVVFIALTLIILAVLFTGGPR